MTRPWVTNVFVPSNIGSAKFSNTNAIVVNLTDPMRMERSQEPSTWRAAPVTPWNLIPVLRKSVMPSAFASVARKAVHAAPESNTARMDTYSVASPAATCNFALRHPVLAAWRYTLSDASVPHTTVIESLVCSVSLSHRSRTSGPCHVHAGLIISSILAVVGAAQTGGDCNASIPASANAW